MMLPLLSHRAMIAGFRVSALLVIASTAPALAQAPSRIDNVWNGRHHEPNPAAVRQREKADGLLPPGTAQRETRTTDQIARELLKGEPAAAPTR